jgi:steroid delta-isomerase-like uncharacterized protein
MKFGISMITAAIGFGLAAAPAQAQTLADDRRVALAWYEAFDQNDPSILHKILRPDWVDIPSPPGVPVGPEGGKGALTMLNTAFPDFSIKVEDMIQEGDKVVVRASITGTQHGPFMGKPASNRRIEIQAVDIHQIKDGKILRTWHTED